jgi:general secretion pathway protein A
MYTEYWKLKCLPFENAPDSRFFFESRGHKEAATRLLFCIQTKKAMALITGDYGSGKSVLCQTTVKRLAPNDFKIALITNPRMDAIDLTREMAYQIGENIQSESKYDVLHAFNNLLDRHHAAGRHCVAIIDEAQLVGSASILEELRLLLNHQAEGQFLLTLILVGQTELNDMLRPIPQLNQRIALKFHIPHLASDEISLYMQHRLETAGGNLSIFDNDTIPEIDKLSKGNPREINALCDTALLTASLSGRPRVTLEDVIDAGRERA